KMNFYNNYILSFAVLLFTLSSVSGADFILHNLDCHFNFEQMQSWDTPDTLTIVAFGNSITAERATIKQVFAQRLPGMLNDKGVKVRVINSGIPGSHTGSVLDNNLFKIKHGRDRFESDVLSHQPDIVLIGFGTNDSYIDSKMKKGKPRIPLKNYKENLEFFIKQLKSIDSEVILIAPNILGAKYPDFQNKKLLKYVKTVRKFAKKYNTGLVDNY